MVYRDRIFGERMSALSVLLDGKNWAAIAYLLSLNMKNDLAFIVDCRMSLYEAYDFDNFHDFSTTPVFDGKSLKKIWNKVVILSIDGCDPQERIQAYL